MDAGGFEDFSTCTDGGSFRERVAELIGLLLQGFTVFVREFFDRRVVRHVNDGRVLIVIDIAMYVFTERRRHALNVAHVFESLNRVFDLFFIGALIHALLVCAHHNDVSASTGRLRKRQSHRVEGFL